MAKSKKRKNKHPKQKPLSLKRPRYDVSNETFNSIINPTISYREEDFSTNDTPGSTLCKEVHEGLLSKVEIERKASQILLEKERASYDFFKEILKAYLDSHLDLDQKLNEYNPNDIRKTMDTINFKEYDADYKSPCTGDNLLKQVYRIINENPDPSLLWPISEYSIIDYSDNLYFVVHRLGYNSETKMTSCEIACYQKFIIFENEKINIPVYQCILDLGVDTFENLNKTLSGITNEEAKYDQLIIKSVNIESVMNGSDPYTYLPIYKIQKMSSVLDLNKFGMKYITVHNPNISANEQKIANSMFTKLITDPLIDYDHKIDSEVHSSNFLRQKLNIPVACIIMTNHMLLTQKMSKPVNQTSARITHVIDDKTPDDTTVRKTRHLGKIKITSEHRPTKPSVDKIIKYTMAQWGRRGFIRRYKSGKIVEIKPTTVHRKCMSSKTDSVSVQTNTEYVIHSDNISNNKK